MIDNNVENEIKELVYAIVPCFDKEDKNKTDYKAEEIKNLIESDDAEFVGINKPFIREITPATVIGKGKLDEIKEDLQEKNANVVVYDGVLSPSQLLNIKNALGVKVIDRTTLILDIFARRATTLEGKLQVELAQLNYIYPRLKGKGEALSRLGGGIGTRGPGETQLETDRRHIRLRIKYLEQSLKNLKTRRNLQVSRRKKINLKTVAIVGYTNAGKSTLINALTNSEVYAEDKLFATLDTTYRKLELENTDVVLVDTVGFISDIPHDLIEAFKSTLESALNADLVLCVTDISDEPDKKSEVTLETLKELKCEAPVITVYNKCDRIENLEETDREAVYVSARTGDGLEKLKRRINGFFSNNYYTIKLSVPFEKIGEYKKMLPDVTVNYEKYTDNGLEAEIVISKENLYKVKKFKTNG